MKKMIMLLSASAGLAFALALPAAADMKTSPAADPAAANKALAEAVSHGEEMFGHDTFGGHKKMNGASVTCQTCHLGGGQVAGRMPDGKQIPSLVNAAAIFPRYNPKLHRVVTLDMQIQKCVKGGLHGQPPAYGSKAMVDMVAYLHSIAKGQPMDSGAAPK